MQLVTWMHLRAASVFLHMGWLTGQIASLLKHEKCPRPISQSSANLLQVIEKVV